MSRVEKYLPFDALEGYKTAINKVNIKQQMIEKPVLSEDQIMEINQTIIESFKTRQQLIVTYYNKGQLIMVKGHIKKVDYSFLYFDNYKVKKDAIIRTEIVI